MASRGWLRRLDRAGGVVVQIVFAIGFLVVGTIAAALLGAGLWAPVWGVLAMVVLSLVLRVVPSRWDDPGAHSFPFDDND